eukprot:gene4720-9367_t
MSRKSKDKKKSEESVYEDQAEEDITEDVFEGTLKSAKTTSWIAGGAQRDKLIQRMLKYANEFGVNSPSVEGDLLVGEFVRGHECMEYLKKFTELIMNYDDRSTRELIIQTSKYNIVPQKIVPLLVQSIEDGHLATKCIILCNTLTYTLDTEASKSISTEIKLIKNKESKEEAKERVSRETKIRDNAYEQISALLSFKEALVNDGVFEAILSYCATSISKPSNLRNMKENKIIERVLVLISNLLAIDAGPMSSPTELQLAKMLHSKLILILEGEFFDFLLFLSQCVREEQNAAWLVLFIEIGASLVRGRDARDLFKIWQSELQVDKQIASNANDKNNDPDHQQSQSQSRLSSSSTANYRSNTTSSNNNNSERGERFGGGNGNGNGNALISLSNSRFRGLYQVKLPQTSSSSSNATNNTSTNKDDSAGAELDERGGGGGSKSLFLRHMPGSGTGAKGDGSGMGCGALGLTCVMPQAHKKRTKKSMTCIKDDVGTRFTSEDRAESAANRCIAHFLDQLLEGAFSELTHSVKEDWRRGDGIIGFRDELNFLRLTAVYKLLEEQKKCDLATAGNKNNNNNNATTNTSSSSSSGIDTTSATTSDVVLGWKPDLGNILQSLDRMSFKRAVASIQRLQEKGPFLDYDQLVVPMEVYKELIAYLNILLQSAETGHHDIALYTLYKVFYISQEKEDPLPQLLRDWKPGVFGKRHLAVLLELNHETMKTLDTARHRFQSTNTTNQTNANNKSKDAPKQPMDEHLEQYIISALRFDVNEYFRRLVTNHTVSLYTRVLELYNTNAPWTNHYAYSFIQRLCAYKVDLDTDGLSTIQSNDNHVNVNSSSQVDVTNSDSSSASSSVSLGHMLFNVQTLTAFSNILNDPSALIDKTMEPLIRLLKVITRRFVQLSQKNHMIFVEALFLHPFPQKFIAQDLEGVYEAHLYSRRSSAGLYGNRNIDNADDINNYSSDHNRDHDRDRENHTRKIPQSATSPGSSSNSDWGDEFDENMPINSGSNNIDGNGLNGQQRSRKGIVVAKGKWTEDEIEELRSLYRLNRGHAKIFENIKIAIKRGRPRSQAAIEKKVRELRIFQEYPDSSDDEDDEKNLQSSDSDSEMEIEPETVQNGENDKNENKDKYNRRRTNKERESSGTNTDVEDRSPNGYNHSNNRNSEKQQQRPPMNGTIINNNSNNAPKLPQKKGSNNNTNISNSNSNHNNNNNKTTVQPVWEAPSDEEEDSRWAALDKPRKRVLPTYVEEVSASVNTITTTSTGNNGNIGMKQSASRQLQRKLQKRQKRSNDNSNNSSDNEVDVEGEGRNKNNKASEDSDDEDDDIFTNEENQSENIGLSKRTSKIIEDSDDD